MPVVINRSGDGSGPKKPNNAANKGTAKKTTRSKKAAAAQSMDGDKVKLVALVAVIVVALGAVGWWFFVRPPQTESPAITNTGKPITGTPPAGTGPGARPPIGPTRGLAPDESGGAFGPNLGGMGNGGARAPQEPATGQTPGPEGPGAGGPTGHGPE